ncbi:MAG: hypothetical protein IAF38_13920 [Bacteroidia bacterium]|nr:hypothetical protein [Bacteroidia bacterium]
MNVITIDCKTCNNIFIPEDGKIFLSDTNKETISSTSLSAFDRKILNICRMEGAIQAIKFCKVSQNWGLKESKDCVDKLLDENPSIFN